MSPPSSFCRIGHNLPVVLAATFCSLIFNAAAQAASFSTQANGNWSDPCTWNVYNASTNSCPGGVPGGSDDAQVNHAVTVASPAGCKNLAVFGTLVLTAQLQVSASINNNGTLSGSSAGSMTFVGTTHPHGIAGLGVWGGAISFGVANGLTAGLQNDVTFGMKSFGIGSGSTFNTFGFALNFTGDSFVNSGTLNLGNTLSFRGLSFQNSSGATISGLGSKLLILPRTDTIVSADFGTLDVPLEIGPGITRTGSSPTLTSLVVNAGGEFQNAAGFTARSNVTVNGKLSAYPTFTWSMNFNGTTFTNNGSVTGFSIISFNSSANPPRSQNIAGTGSWVGENLRLGVGSASAPSTVTLQNDITVAAAQVDAGYTLNLNGHVLTYTGGGSNNGNGPGFTYGAVSGPGLLKIQPTSGQTRFDGTNGASAFTAAVQIVSGTVTAALGFSTALRLDGPLTVDAGATLTLAGYGGSTKGNVTNNGTLNVSDSNATLQFQGDTFTNSGAVVGTPVSFGLPSGSGTQNLGGTGSWTNGGRLFIPAASTVTLLNHVTYGGGTFWNEGAVSTGAFSFSLPCGTIWSGQGDVVGRVRRTNLGACPGSPIAFGNPFTTITFTSGTAPTEVSVDVALSAPAGFPNAVKRSYQITPTGGSGWSATLRLHYLDSELNGNDENTLSLWRNNGSNWQVQGASGRNTSANWVEYGGVTQFSPWTLASSCFTSISPTSQNFPSYGDNGSVSVTATAGCNWTATSNADWISVTGGASGSGDGEVGYYVSSNNGAARTGTMTIAGQTFTVTQDSGCAVYIYEIEKDFSSSGGTSSVPVYAGDGCGWTAASNDAWIVITSGASGSGEEAVNYSVASNPGPPRTGTLSIAEHTFTVRQGSNAPLALAVTNTDDSGPGSLRQALLNANGNVGQTNTIQFNIAGPATISPATALPAISNPVTINGINSNGARVELNGANLTTSGNGLTIFASQCAVRGLVINRFPNSGIHSEGDNTVIENCFVGTDATGAFASGNGGEGIAICSDNNRIGGTAPGASNIIAANGYVGVAAYCGSGNVIQNNYIGTNSAGANLGNADSGIGVYSVNTTVGGITASAGNTIGFNGGAGVVLYDGLGNAIRGNSIFSNVGLGIDLDGDGVTPNDAGDVDTGRNNLQNFPLISAQAGSSVVTGTLNSTAATAYAIEFFANAACDPVGHGEGQTFLGATTTTTSSSGNASFSFSLPSNVATGASITATATDVGRNTSEFSECLQVRPLKITSTTRLTNRAILLQGRGVPNQLHTIEASDSLSPNSFVPLTPRVAADANGFWQYEAAVETNVQRRFYRVTIP